MIICAGCGEEKPHEAKGLCNPCYWRLWRKRNPERARAIQQRHVQVHRESDRAYDRAYWQTYKISKNNHCIDCGELIKPRSVRCHSCSMKGELHPNWAGYGLCSRCGKRQATARGFCNICYAKVRRIAYPVPENLTLIDKRCFYCGQPANTWDHFIPIAGGGLPTRGNLVPACLECNQRKGTKPIRAILQQLELEALCI